MIAFGSSIDDQDAYRRCAQVGVERVSERDSRVFAFSLAGTVPRTYNLILDRAAELPELEALILVHEDAEIVDDELCAKLRRELDDPEVAIVGCVGATGVRSIAWWDGTVTRNSVTYRYEELGGGEVPWPDDGAERAPGPVDSVYGVLLALSPWAVRNLRFDESLGPIYGHDFDLCAQARAAGRKVVAADLKIAHHHSLDVLEEEESFMAAHIAAAEKWDRAELTEDQWRSRARAAEADAGAARLLASSMRLQADATAVFHEERLAELRGTPSWRLTEPLRQGNKLGSRVRGRLRGVKGGDG